MKIPLNQLYDEALKIVMENGYQKEVEWVRGTKLESVTKEKFLTEYIWVVLNSGMKNSIAKKIFEKFMQTKDFNTIGHLGKREAIKTVLAFSNSYFNLFLSARDKVGYLEMLPFIGSITKFHLARNLGVDCVKPDRHIVRLAKEYGYDDVNKFCAEIAEQKNERIGVVDVVLWRYCVLRGEP